MEEKKESILETAKFYFLNQKYDKAIEIYREGLESYPDEPQLYFNLGVVYESINDLENAKECFEKVLSLDKDFKAASDHLKEIIGN
ncbi:MAG: tetratricopeptide repeat protein [bacterium]|nr:tetratricopeptide repeat protein [candidate division WOR-3 bacterium]